MLSIWERESFINYDVIIVGAGISGLSTAASLKEKIPGLDILVLERGTLPTGASTKNAGFACFGSVSELAQDRKIMGDDQMIELVSKRWSGLQKTISRLGKDKIGLEQKGGYELLSPANSHYLEEIEEINGLLKDQFSHPVFAESAKKLEEFKFGKTSHMVYNPFEGQLHSGKLIRSLWDYCNQLGVKTLTGTRVTSIDQNEGSVDVNTEEIRFTAKAVALCTNAFTKSLTKDYQLDITPGRGMVMLVESKEPIPFEGTFHYDEGYYYFRDYHGKVIFGGGRNLEIEKEQTSEFGINKNIEQKLLLDLQEVILPGGEFKVEMKWSGIMAFGATKEPVIKQLGSGLYLGVRLGGMGVALGSMVGDDLAAMLEKDHF